MAAWIAVSWGFCFQNVCVCLCVWTRTCTVDGLDTFNYYKVLWFSFPSSSRLPAPISISPLCGWLFML